MTANLLLIEPTALSARLGEPGLSVVDASCNPAGARREPHAEFEAGHVPGAVFFDHDAIVDPTSDLPHSLPSAEIFGAAAGELGITENDTIVVYDGEGLFSAARGWWLFHTFGARKVLVLDGGLPAWRAAGLPLETGTAKPKPRRFAARLDRSAIVDLAEMRQVVASEEVQIADARSAERFAGSVAEPRPGVRGGHMPGARSLPFGALVENGRLKPAEALAAEFAKAGIDPRKPVVTSCGSGITAAVINLALASTGAAPGRLYDGSWTEWGTAPDTPVETGPARRT